MHAEELLKAFGVGLTGGIATGKSTVARLLAARGSPVIDADGLARAVTTKDSPGLAEIVAVFGAEILAATGELDRKKLGALVFQDAASRKRLEAITHPRIQQALVATVRTLGLLAAPRLFFYEAALLVETGSQQRFRSLWVTTCPLPLQRERLMARDHRTLDEAEQILAAQMPDAVKTAAANIVIDTDGTLSALMGRVELALAAELARIDIPNP